jgi:SAM-dependent methyltransferase
VSAGTGSSEAIWQDVESGGYAADLAIWDELADTVSGPVLELGAGTGRVALRLAARGHQVTAVDTEEPLLAALRDRASADGLELETVRADARRLDLGSTFGAVLAPMQLVHLLEGPAGRLALLTSAARHLQPGGCFAAALLADAATWIPFEPASPPLPDVLERDGWVYSSQPTEIAAVPGGIEIRRLRQAVSPEGELAESTDAILLASLTPDELELEARAAGLVARERIEIDPTADHIGSTVCVLEAG